MLICGDHFVSDVKYMCVYEFLFRHSCFVQDIGILGPGENEVLCLRGALTDLEVLCCCSVTKTVIVMATCSC